MSFASRSLASWAVGPEYPWFSFCWPCTYRSPFCYPSYPLLASAPAETGSPTLIPVFKTTHTLCPGYLLLVNVWYRILSEMDLSLRPSKIIVKSSCSRALQGVSTCTYTPGTNEVSFFQLRTINQKGNAHQNSSKGSMLKNAAFSLPI